MCFSPLPGLTSRPFQGFHNIRVLECTGSSLDSSVDVMSMVLYTIPQDKVLASVYTLKGECSTSDGNFASCVIDAADSKKTRLRALLTDLLEGETRVYGCNVTSFRSGGRVKIITWSLVVRLRGKHNMCLVRPKGKCALF